MATASADKSARLWDVDTGRATTILAGHRAEVSSAAFSHDGKLVVTASADTTARIFDAATGRTVLVLGGQRHPRRHSSRVADPPRLNSAALSPDGLLVVTAADDGATLLWGVVTGGLIGLPRHAGSRTSSAEFSPDGRRVITAYRDQSSPSAHHGAFIWEVDTGQTIVALDGLEAEVESAAFSPDARRVVTASRDGAARIHDAPTGKVMTVLAGHAGPVMSAQFSADGRRVVTASADKTARIFDAETGKTIGILDGHAGRLLRAAFSADGKRVVTASADGTARVWQVFPTTQDLIDDARQNVPRCLSGDQREKFSLDPAPPAWCIEMAKWAYDTSEWKAWLAQKKSGQEPPLPKATGP